MFHTPVSSGSSITGTVLKNKYRFHEAAMSALHFTGKKNILTKSYISLENLLPTVYGVRMNSTSQFHTVASLVLPMAGN
jgi:hypothetical protein